MTVRDIGEVKISDLKALSILIDQRSVTRTADMLDMTQSAISKILARLRIHFADPLLLRSGQSMIATPLAVEMATSLRAILASTDAFARQAPFDAKTSTRVFRLVVSDVGMARFLPPLIAHIEEQSTSLGLHALPLDGRPFASKLEAGEADLALGAFPNAPRALRRQMLYIDEYLSATRSNRGDHDRLRTRRGFCAARHIIITRSDTGHAAHQMVQEALEAVLSPHNVLLRVPSFIAAAIVASQTAGVATLPANLAKSLAGPLALHVFRCPLPLPSIEIAQYWHERQQLDSGHQWLRRVCFNLFGRSARSLRNK